MSARDVLTVMIRTDRGCMTVWSPQEVQKAIDAHRAEVLREAYTVVDVALSGESDDRRASALYEALLQLGALQLHTCAPRVADAAEQGETVGPVCPACMTPADREKADRAAQNLGGHRG